MNDLNDLAQSVAEVVARSKIVRGNVEKAREIVKTYTPAENELIHISRAACHPLLGGSMRKDKKNDVPGPTFSQNSLRLAIEKGDLVCIWKKGKQFVTAAAIRDWLSRSDVDGERKPSQAKVISIATPTTRTTFEKQRGSASVANASAKLLDLSNMLKNKKKGGK